MADQPGVWGIDVGQCALKALRVALIDGKITATAFDFVEHAKILSQPDADPDQLTREALDRFLSRNSLKGDTVCISVPGQSGLARFVKLPPVEEKKIVDIVRFEAKQQIPFNLDEVVWDYQKIGSGVVSDGFAMETEIGLFAMKRDVINRSMTHFQDVGVEVQMVQMAPLSLCNFVAYDLLNKGTDSAAEAAGEEEDKPQKGAKKSCAVALDIGADSSSLVITDGDRIIWQRPIPLGGNNFTRILTKDLKLTFAKAEHLKRNATKSPDLKKILASLKPVLNDFVGEVQRSLGYFTNTHRDAQIEYLVGLGGAFRLPGLQRFLAEKLQLDVRKLQKFERLEGDPVTTAPQFTENILSFSVAYGLALQGLKLTRLQTNLLPPEIRMERMIRAKKPWAVAAAAALLLGVGGLALSYAMEIRAVNLKPVQDAIQEGKAIEKDKQKWDTEFNSAQGQVEGEKKAVQAVRAGQEERLNWIKLEKFINDCLPRPDDKNEDINLYGQDPRPAKEQYWTKEAREAHDKLKKRLAQGTALSGKDDLPEGVQHLVQLNIESFDCRFVESLPTFLAQLLDPKAGADISSLRPKAPLGGTMAKPEGPGWVIELRGYTYHEHQSRFVIETLVENIAHLGAPQMIASAKPALPPPKPQPGKPELVGPATVPEPEKKREDVVVDKVSHVLIYKVQSETNFTPNTYSLIGTSALPTILGTGGVPGDNPQGGRGELFGGGNARPAGGRASWQPLPTGGQTSAFGGHGEGAKAPPPGGIRFGDKPPQQKPDEPPKDKPRTGPEIKRTEFIILFVWKEPIPSAPPEETSPVENPTINNPP